MDSDSSTENTQTIGCAILAYVIELIDRYQGDGKSCAILG